MFMIILLCILTQVFPPSVLGHSAAQRLCSLVSHHVVYVVYVPWRVHKYTSVPTLLMCGSFLPFQIKVCPQTPEISTLRTLWSAFLNLLQSGLPTQPIPRAQSLSSLLQLRTTQPPLISNPSLASLFPNERSPFSSAAPAPTIPTFSPLGHTCSSLPNLDKDLKQRPSLATLLLTGRRSLSLGGSINANPLLGRR